jgi:hypothetical protein
MMYRLVFIVKLFFLRRDGVLCRDEVLVLRRLADREDDKLASWEETGRRGIVGWALRYFRKIGTGNRRVQAQRAGQESPAEEISIARC